MLAAAAAREPDLNSVSFALAKAEVASLQEGSGSGGSRLSEEQAASHFLARYARQLGENAATGAQLRKRLDAISKHRLGLSGTVRAQRDELGQPGLLHKDARILAGWCAWPAAEPAPPDAAPTCSVVAAPQRAPTWSGSPAAAAPAGELPAAALAGSPLQQRETGSAQLQSLAGGPSPMQVSPQQHQPGSGATPSGGVAIALNFGTAWQPQSAPTSGVAVQQQPASGGPSPQQDSKRLKVLNAQRQSSHRATAQENVDPAALLRAYADLQRRHSQLEPQVFMLQSSLVTEAAASEQLRLQLASAQGQLAERHQLVGAHAAEIGKLQRHLRAAVAYGAGLEAQLQAVVDSRAAAEERWAAELAVLQAEVQQSTEDSLRILQQGAQRAEQAQVEQLRAQQAARAAASAQAEAEKREQAAAQREAAIQQAAQAVSRRRWEQAHGRGSGHYLRLAEAAQQAGVSAKHCRKLEMSNFFRKQGQRPERSQAAPPPLSTWRASTALRITILPASAPCQSPCLPSVDMDEAVQRHSTRPFGEVAHDADEAAALRERADRLQDCASRARVCHIGLIDIKVANTEVLEAGDPGQVAQRKRAAASQRTLTYEQNKMEKANRVYAAAQAQAAWEGWVLTARRWLAAYGGE
jgi:hypothetical protein